MRIGNKYVGSSSEQEYSYMSTTDKCTNNSFVVPFGIFGNTDWRLYLKCSTSAFSDSVEGFISDASTDTPVTNGSIHLSTSRGWVCDTGKEVGTGRISIKPSTSTSINDVYEITRTPMVLKVVKNYTEPFEAYGYCPRTDFTNLNIFKGCNVSITRRIYRMTIWQGDVMLHDYIPGYGIDPNSSFSLRPCWKDLVGRQCYFNTDSTTDQNFTLDK